MEDKQMDLMKHGALIRDLRKAKGLTQKQLAEKLSIEPKTVSKWETGHGFPDVSLLSTLADILETSEKTLLQGNLIKNTKQAGNIQKAKFYVCPDCDSNVQTVGECQIFCCGKPLSPLRVVNADEKHSITISEIENDLYIEGFK